MLDSLDFRDPKLDRLTSQIVDADHEYRSAVGLKLAGRRPNKHKRILLTRDNGRLSHASSLLLWLTL
jgi:hypothetical protein